MTQPQSSDAILGNQTPPPVNSAILGGIEGLQQQMQIAEPKQRSQLLPSALQYGEAGIDFLINILNNDPVLTVRAEAYQHLQESISVQSEPISQKIQQVIEQGIPLKVGDRLYHVYISAIDYDDQCYSLLDSVAAYEGHNFYYDGERLHPVACFVVREIAEELALALHRVFLANGDLTKINQRYHLNINPKNYHLFNIASEVNGFYWNYNKPMREWCILHQIDIDLDEYLNEEYSEEDDYWGEAQEAVLEEVLQRHSDSLLEELCNFLEMGKFAFVHKEIVDRDRFFPTTGQLRWYSC